ncbi:RT_RNaseH_2 domain-containing protein [Nephila pilipes]|uniref:RT_RNaseH_2 domain-containing protein n=1 Tax=Nephila pilipes TaxID=299642 RepID=A0A8X6JXS2_NEPPI|nr:RT_RNaseH_2 domain-containing protein [Nephila pilipes]
MFMFVDVGMFNFYCRFLPKAVHILSPLIKFLEGHTNEKRLLRSTKKKTNPSLQWSEEAEKAFTDSKKALAEATLLKHPIPSATLSL